MTINGKPLDVYNTFQHSEFKAGGELHFVMTANKSEAMRANFGQIKNMGNVMVPPFLLRNKKNAITFIHIDH
ncbi:hypothetical protein DP83_07345 [Vibrio metoecus]|uniref:Uncharacterized protein n=1 Tax=Vibrio metoecus TaxID=1481663 RepID=A0ABR4RY26_VIBMT|nr:hypothetical protein DP83_07345 [Vibrio metoecus]